MVCVQLPKLDKNLNFKKKLNMKRVSIILLTFILSQHCFASQLNDFLSLEKKVDISQFIVEGQIVEQESYWDVAQNEIMTAYKVLVYKSFKQDVYADEITIIGRGGILGDKMHKTFPACPLKKGQIGIFFLKDAPIQQRNTNGPSETQHALLDQRQSVLHYDLIEKKAMDTKHTYNDVTTELYPLLEKLCTKKRIEWNTFKLTKDHSDNSLHKSSTTDIECIFPNIVEGGNNQVVSISGSGFGPSGPWCKVKLPDPDTGGNSLTTIDGDQILYWSDDLIEFIVPEDAGSGVFTLYLNSGATFISEEEIQIKFAINTSGSTVLPSMLVGQNSSNGYDFKYSTTTSNNGVNFATSPGAAPFERALEYLQEAVGLNAEVTGNINSNIISDDDVNIVMFDRDNSPLSGAGLLHAQYSRCGGMWEVVGMDVIFRRQGDLNWNFSADLPSWDELDFESVALHELAHGLQVKHNMQSESVMYFAYNFGEHKRVLTHCFDYPAIEIVNERSTTYTPQCSNYTPYTLHPSFNNYNYSVTDCQTPTECGVPINIDKRIRIKVALSGFLDNSSTMRNILSYTDLLPSEQPFNNAPWFYTGTENTNGNFPGNITDWVLVDLYEDSTSTTPVATKAGFVNIHGIIIDEDGDEGLEFPNLASNAYYAVVRQCSHLAIMSSSPIQLGESEPYDFTSDPAKAKGVNQLVLVNGVYAMLGGDYDANGIINNLDFNKWNIANSLVNSYVSWDGDGNGIVNNQDFNIWTVNKSKIGYEMTHL